MLEPTALKRGSPAPQTGPAAPKQIRALGVAPLRGADIAGEAFQGQVCPESAMSIMGLKIRLKGKPCCARALMRPLTRGGGSTGALLNGWP